MQTLSPITQRHFRDVRAGRTAIDSRWHTKAVMDATAVKRVLHPADPRRAVAGVSESLRALNQGEVQEWLQTSRFIETNPDIAERVAELSDVGRLVIRRISGVAAAQLDLAADGVGALIRRPAVAAESP